ncbi:IucA/IucC family protein [Cupriavidus lacunae]|uniref:IucA/IucC family siderophore biosynthesis protein n=1 Tax=Cupriavidus lacunae TaxID=2666307 RepID=A0A370NWI8_9BURK|nr:IucA/IucC family protein [Cupriavidus lacunae]RDK09964.1 IucA/IucC family siderophore biosynthesis protein [Cupriavidus lacunae]
MNTTDYQCLIQSPHYRQAARRVVRQLLEALLFEDCLRDVLVTGDGVELPAMTADGTPVSYRCTARPTASFGRIRIDGPVLRCDASAQTEADDVAMLLSELAGLLDADPVRLQQFGLELLSTQIKDAQSHHANGHAGRPLREASYDAIEARLTGAHPYHPSYKSRMGFTLADNRRYAPECAAPLHPVLLAAHRSHCRWNLGNAEASPENLLPPPARAAFEAAVRERGADPADYLPLPVHPWQWDEVIAPGYHGAFARGELIVVGEMPGRYLPQQSIRTLANVDQPDALSLKLAMNLVNTSTSRVLAPHTVCNAAVLSDWLASLVARTEWSAPMAAPVLLREVAGISHVPAAPVQGQYGALSCIWRESINGHLASGEAAIPMTALTHIDVDGLPLIDLWIRRHGVRVWLQRLVERAWLPVLHLLWEHGTALESHAQNMLLLHVDGLPQRVALKDFHDGVRFSRQWLSGTAPQLTPPPAEHARVNPNSFIETDDAEELRDFTCDALFFVNLAELAPLLAAYYQLEETEFWTIVAGVIRSYQRAHPHLADSFRRFDCFAPTMSIELLASRRFMPEIRLRTRQAPNPLAEAA